MAVTTQLWPTVVPNITNFTTEGTQHVLQRYTQEQLYAIYRPTISIITKYITPVWYVIGFPSNMLAFTVWVQPRMRPSSGCYLAALAMSDVIFLILHLVFELQMTWDVRLLKLPVLCEVFPIFFLSSQYMSPLLVLAFTVERFIAICHPFRREKFCTTSRAIKVIIGLVILSMCIHAVQGYFWIYRADIDECTIRDEMMLGGTKSVWSVWSWITELLVFGLVPVVILILNILVIKEAQKLSRTEESRLCLRRGHKTSAATLTLLSVSFYLILTTLPVTLFYAMYLSFPEGDFFMSDDEIAADPTWQRHFTYFLIRTLVEELGMSHFACNFFIYVSTGKLFRRELTVLFLKIFNKKKLEEMRRGEFNESMMTSVPRAGNHSQNGNVAHL
uniref:Orphan G-protein coupled receptor 50 n=1 Tax=Platynereis dumerilii TaxID=6359 RepID=A0A0K0PUI8_PLADU|nr:orphan G-protein coupled receptor 50 [Platynereis dumerilii]